MNKIYLVAGFVSLLCCIFTGFMTLYYFWQDAEQLFKGFAFYAVCFMVFSMVFSQIYLIEKNK